MNANSNAIGIIPARGGSRGVPRKNIRLLAGKPLLAWTIEAALQSGLINRVIVSTEDPEIASVSRQYGAEVIDRPGDLARDETPTEPVMLQVLEDLEKTGSHRPGVVVLLQATSPLRNSRHIQEALAVFQQGNYDSLLSVCPSHAFIWKNGESGAHAVNYDYHKRPRRQDAEPEFRENGAIYVTSREIMLGRHNRLGGRIGLYIMEDEDSVEIDSPYDFWLCQQILEQRGGSHARG